MENIAAANGKTKETTTQDNRQVLGDISNLEVARNAEAKQASRPITRNCHANSLEAISNDEGAAQAREKSIQPALDNTTVVHNKQKRSGEESVDFHEKKLKGKSCERKLKGKSCERKLKEKSCERKYKGKSCRKVKTLTVEITPQSQAASGVLIEPVEQNVVIEDAANAAVAEYLDDIYKFSKQAEVDFEIQDYMNSQPEINEKMRSITVDWLVEVHWQFEMMPETLYLTVNILDRYLSLTYVPKTELQLVGISSMLIACKYEEIHPPSVKVFAKLSAGGYTKEQVVIMENAILEKLQWYLTIPTPYVFLVRYIRAYGQPDHEDIVEMENIVFFLAELGLVNYQAILYRPSVIAAAAVYAARCTLKRSPLWTEILKLTTGYTTEQIICCAKLLARLQSRAADTKINVVYRKYMTSGRRTVALLPPPTLLLNNS